MIHRFICLIGLGLSSLHAVPTFDLQHSAHDENTEQVHITVTLDKGEALYHDTITFTINNPAFSISSWESNITPQPFFDHQPTESRPAYQGTVTFTLTLQNKKWTAENGQVDLFMHYMTNQSKAPQEKRFIVRLSKFGPAPQETQKEPESAFNTSASATTTTSRGNRVPDLVLRLKQALFTWFVTIKQQISGLFSSSTSLPMQFLLAYLLGIVMSLTPCIYPMIPVTVGLLGTHADNSFRRNFSLAFSYTVGLATTFALLGLLTTLCGVQCGTLMSKPWFVIILVVTLGYLGGSMFGWYEMAIPRLLKPRQQTIKQGSLLSAFLFGVGTGTIASPCMSPGLALVLSIVATMGNIFLGFLLLFVFGLGTSTPLLLIGTFSASLNILPKAGMWMIEMKKVFGFMLFGICFYYLNHILPEVVLLPALTCFFVVAGMYYITRLVQYRSIGGKLIAFLFACGLVSAALYTGYSAYKAFITTSDHATPSAWRTDYEQAQKEAIRDHKKLLLDFGASWCSLCIELEKHVLNEPVLTQLFDRVVAIRIDGSVSGSQPYTFLVNKYKILGLPTLLLIDPMSGAVIKRWSSELLDRGAESFAQELAALL